MLYSWRSQPTHTSAKIPSSVGRNRVASISCKLECLNFFTVAGNYSEIGRCANLRISTKSSHFIINRYIEVRYIQFHSSATFLYIFNDLKVPRQRPCFVITLPSRSDDDRLRTSELLQFYIEKTKPFWLDQHYKLFLSRRPPQKPVTTDTLARWIRSIMQKAGLNTDIFSGHSVSGASASYALSKNDSIDTILQAEDWLWLHTFNKHYNRIHLQTSSTINVDIYFP